MALTLKQFTEQLIQSGLVPASQLTAYLRSLPERPVDAESLAKQLISAKKLTSFQAQQVWKQKAKHLVLGNYTISEKLGQGGMGMVFKASHKLMKRDVALKVLPPAFTKDEQAVKRFLREVEAAAKLTHPHIVAALDADHVRDSYFLIMEYVEGRDLSVLVKKQGPAKAEQAIDFVLQAARGLEYAHQNGVIHRDIKPANLLLDKSGTVKVLDMGLARIEGDSSNAATLAGLTGSGTMMGTIDYMAPEQADDSKRAGPQADIYSLGATLHFLLTAQPMIEGDTVGKKLRVLLTGVGLPESIQTKRPDIPRELDAVFCKMTAFSMPDRYLTMSDVIADLEAIQAGTTPQSVSSTGIQPVAAVRSDESAMNSFLNHLDDGTEVIEQTLTTLPVPTTDSDTIASHVGEATNPAISKAETFAATLKSSHNRVPVIGGSIAVVVLLTALIWGLSQGGGDAPSPEGDSVAEPQLQTKPPELISAKGDDAIPSFAVAPFDKLQAQKHQHAWADYLGLPIEKEVVLPGGEKMAFVLVPPGEFMMGSSDEDIKHWRAQEDPNSALWQGHLKSEGPQHRVRITEAFYLGKYEVTQAQWQSVTSGQPSKSREQIRELTWDDTQPFLQKLNEGVGTPEIRFALPTEAQWEFACRAGTTTAWYSGDDEEELQRYAWIRTNAGSGPKPIGQRLPNAFGLYDMHGNTSEWCADWYSPDYYAVSPIEDPTGPSSGTKRMKRGGGSRSPANHTRSAYRYPSSPDKRNTHPGFRVAMTIDTAKLKQAQTTPADPDRERMAAEWVLTVDNRPGTRKVTTNLGEFTSLEQLPKTHFFITGIQLERCGRISDEGLAQLNGLSRIERLHIHATHVGDVACRHIAKLTTLKWLTLHSTEVSDEGLVHLKRLPHLEYLVLSFGYEKITDEGLQHLAGMTDLRNLSLAGQDISGKGLAYLVGLQKLTHLSLQQTRLNDDGLLRVKQLLRLEYLELHDTTVTDDGLAHLKATEKLKRVSVGNTQVTAAGVADLQKALPNCVILNGPSTEAPIPTNSPFNKAKAKAHQKAWADHLGLPVEKEVALPGGEKMTFTLIPPGEFLIGSTKEQLAEVLNAAEIFQVVKDRIQADESPAHKVIITKPYYLGATEVTVGQFKEFATSSRYKTVAEKDPKTATDKTYLNPQFSTTDDLPVPFMSWKDADAFCRWLSEKHDKIYRLPTEAEWEYACRAGTTTHFSFGDDVKQMDAFAWNVKNSGRKPHPVGKKSPNAFGLFDMHGNMHEWCGDWYEEGWYKKSPPEDPIGPSTGSYCVLRGCTWGNEGFLLRSAFRDFGPQHDRNGGTGFRVVLTIESAKLKTSQTPPANPKRKSLQFQ